MKSPFAAVFAMLCFACVKQPPPVNAPTVIDIPPMPAQGPTRHIVVVRTPPRPEFHYAFQYIGRHQWTALGTALQDDIVGAPADLVLQSAALPAVMTFHSLDANGRDAVSLATGIAASLAESSYETSEPQAWHTSAGLPGASFSWKRALADGQGEFCGRVFVIGFDDVPGRIFAVSGAWRSVPADHAGAAELAVEGAASTLLVIPKRVTEK